MIIVLIGGLQFFHDKSCRIFRSMDTVCGTFELNISDRWAAANLMRQILPNDPCQIYIDSNKVIDGYIDSVKPQLLETGNLINISGRDKTGDLVDCAVVHKTGEWNGLKLDRIIKEICAPFKIEVTVDKEIDVGDAIPFFRIEQGMTAFEAIEKLCSLRGFMAVANSSGGIVITRASDDVIGYQFVEGVNIIEASANYDASQRFSTYTVTSQAQTMEGLFGAVAFSSSATVTDNNITRYRPTVIVEGSPINTKTCQQMAKWQLAKHIGKSRSFQVRKQGLLQDDGSLWPINKNVHLRSSYLGIDEQFLITSVENKVDDQGESTMLTLVPKDAYLIIPELKLEKQKETSNSLFGNA
jgi:prophage tail gpP-like protein